MKSRHCSSLMGERKFCAGYATPSTVSITPKSRSAASGRLPSVAPLNSANCTTAVFRSECMESRYHSVSKAAKNASQAKEPSGAADGNCGGGLFWRGGPVLVAVDEKLATENQEPDPERKAQ